MMYVGFDGTGYRTALATSTDLLHWEHLSVILRRGEGSGWDTRNIAGTWMMRENQIDAPAVLKKWDGKYWLVYYTYPDSGYEAGPGRIGLAWTEDESLLDGQRLPEPILTPEEGSDWERGGLYKECLLEREGTFYLFYNTKNSDSRWVEQIGLAHSKNLLDWTQARAEPAAPGEFRALGQRFCKRPVCFAGWPALGYVLLWLRLHPGAGGNRLFP